MHASLMTLPSNHPISPGNGIDAFGHSIATKNHDEWKELLLPFRVYTGLAMQSQESFE
jgi:hypothetical protein